MKYIALPDLGTQRLSFYLAMEEYVARNVDEDDCFFMWQVEPSVIFGRNQLIENEVNLDYCRAHHVMTYRRKSGGGCVYADMSNVMCSYITKADNVALTYNRYINMVVLVLRKLGVEARAGGRNDIMIGDRKVSGNAFYHLPGRSIVHGTLLYDTNMQNMVGAITPTNEKLLSKGVESVRQRIALLKDYLSVSLDEVKNTMRSTLCDGEIMLNEHDIEAIREIEREYLSPSFIYGNNPKYTIVKKRRIEGVGEFELRMEMKNRLISDVNLVGDFFIVGDLDGALLKPMKGVERSEEALASVIPEHTEEIILRLKREDLISMMTDSNLSTPDGL